MTTTTTNSVSAGTSQGDESAIAEVARLLEAQSSAPILLTTADGQAVALPEAAVCVLHAAMQLLASGQPVAVLPSEEDVSRIEAAHFLNVRPEYIDRLVESGELPKASTGALVRIGAVDLFAYRQRRREIVRENLRELTRLSEELGMYDPDFPVPGEE